jgi:SAM-dependent methyltransferase
MIMNKDFYRTFEDKFRGSRELIKSRLRVYLPFLKKLKTMNTELNALDLGCGRGEWLELLREEGFNGHGVDSDEGMLEWCHKLGIMFTKQDIIEYLAGLPDESQLIVSGFHVAEHISFPSLQTLISEALRVLKPCGLLILETPNPENLLVATINFYLDPTHQRPLPPDLLVYLSDYYGYQRCKILRLQESPQLVNEENVQLIDVISGVSPDYAIVAQKNGPLEHLNLFNSEFEKEYGIDIKKLMQRYELQQQNKIVELQTVLNKTVEEVVELNKQCHAISECMKEEVVELNKQYHSILECMKKEIRDIHISKAWQVALLLRKGAQIFRTCFKLCMRPIHKMQKVIKRILSGKTTEITGK